MKIVLIRHLPPLIEPGICYGRLDVPPHPGSALLARALAVDLALCGITHVWSSPARRCQELAAEIALVSRVTFTTDRRLLELDFGEWEGKEWDAIARTELDLWAAAPLTFAPPGGESGEALIRRVGDFCADLDRDRRPCAIVSHGGPLKVLAALLEGRPVDLLGPAPPLGSVKIVTHSCNVSAACDYVFGSAD
jgi:alpha-ribazole phosphatase